MTALPWILIAIGVVLNLSTAQGLPGSPLFIVAPLVAAPFVSTRVTALTALVSAALLAVLRIADDTTGLQDDLTRVATVLLVGVLAVGISRLLRRRGADLATARVVAESAQLAVLPVPPHRIDGVRVAARYRAAESEARIGGDLYAVQPTPHGVRLVVGDVRGKGLGAVGTVVVVLGAFREAADEEASLEAVAERLDRALVREGRRRAPDDDEEDFTTAVLAEIPAGRPEVVRVLNRGHPPPLLLGGGRARFLEPDEAALPLGMAGLGRLPDRTTEVPFPPGVQLLFCTDGLTEARDHGGSFFDPGERLAERSFDDPESLLDAVLGDVRAHTNGDARDDMALMALQRDKQYN